MILCNEVVMGKKTIFYELWGNFRETLISAFKSLNSLPSILPSQSGHVILSNLARRTWQPIPVEVQVSEPKTILENQYRWVLRTRLKKTVSEWIGLENVICASGGGVPMMRQQSSLYGVRRKVKKLKRLISIYLWAPFATEVVIILVLCERQVDTYHILNTIYHLLLKTW